MTRKLWGGVVAALLLLVVVPDVMEAQYGTGIRRRTRRRTAVVVGTSVHAADEAAAAQKAAAQKPAAPAASPGVGSVVSTLPAGCTRKTVSGAEYHQCGATWYKAAFEGDQLVYVTTPPPG